MSLQIESQQNLLDILRSRAEQQLHRTAFKFLTHRGTREETISFGELATRARMIAGHLRLHGTQGDRILLFYPPGLEYIAAFLGCLEAGMVAVPLYPPRSNQKSLRAAGVIVSCGASIALTSCHSLEELTMLISADEVCQHLDLFATEDLPESCLQHWVQPKIEAETLAFLQYTSGSTGTPKGVMVTHGNLMANQKIITEVFGTREDDICLSWLPLYHDMGLIGTVLQGLYRGFVSILMPPVNFIRDPCSWLDAITHYGATLCGAPNFAYELLLRKASEERMERLNLSSWRVAFNGAEPVRADTLRRFSKRFEGRGFSAKAFYPCYGMAEATLLISSVGESAPKANCFDAAGLESHRALTTTGGRPLVSCGKPASGYQLLIVDPEHHEECADGSIGEIWVQGPSVTPGYWGMAAETEATFNRKPRNHEQGSYMRTGDLGFLYGGELYVTGRLKDLIIVRGRNHAPHDIEETTSKCHATLALGGTAAFTITTNDEERLVVVQEVRRDHLQSLKAEAVISTVRAAVASQHELQVYAVALVPQGRVPKTSSGKVQRSLCKQRYLKQQLQTLSSSILKDASSSGQVDSLDRETLVTSPPDDRQPLLEHYLRQVIAQVLKQAPDQISDSESLISLGLDSLMTIEIQHRLETELQITIPQTLFLEERNLPQLAEGLISCLKESVASSEEKAAPLEMTVNEPDETRVIPLSLNQEALWFLYQLEPGSAAYNISFAVNIYKELDVNGLRAAFTALLERHPTLRTTYEIHEGQPQQRVHATAALQFEVIDSAAWSEQQLEAHLEAEAHRPFDLNKGPVLRLLLLSQRPDRHVFLLSCHHIAVDFWSLWVLMDELRELYPSGKSTQLKPQLASYADYVAGQVRMMTRSKGERLRAYWTEKLAGLAILDLQTDYPRPPRQTYHGTTYAFKIENPLANQVKTLARHEGATLYTTLMAAFQACLYRYTGQEDLAVGSATAGRSRAEYDHLVGYFVNQFVVRGDASGQPSFRTFLGRIKETVLEALAHQDYPFQVLVKQLQPERDPSRSPLFQVVFVLQKAQRLKDSGPFALREGEAIMKLGPLLLESRPLKQRFAQFDMTLFMAETIEGFSGSLEYNTELFEEGSIARFIGHFQNLLVGLVAEPDRPLLELPLLSSEESQLVLKDWNQTEAAYPQKETIPQLFEAQVARTAQSPALDFEGDRLDFQQLNRQANKVAHYLRRLGVAPEVPVAICLNRSLSMVSGLIGLLKAGGPYVPLDPSYPMDRLDFMLRDSGATVLLTEHALADKFPDLPIQVVLLDGDWLEDPNLPETNPNSLVEPENPFYITYTSGSTGRPKGVLAPHRLFVIRFHWMWQNYPFGVAEQCCQKTALSFGDSAWEIFGPLLQGVPVAIIADHIVKDPRQFVEVLAARDVSRLVVVPSLLRAMLAQFDDLEERLASLKYLVTSGEALPLDLFETFRKSLPNCRLLNLYGASEVSPDVIYCDTGQTPARQSVPIGKPISNATVYVLNPRLHPTPAGIAGELCIGGKVVSRGYVERPAMTATRFIPNPYSRVAGERLFRTGDRARQLLPHGAVEYLGRVDHQIKLRGFRIEPGEIEASLRTHEQVVASVVILREDEPDDKRLVAYVQTKRTSTESPAAEIGTLLREFLKEALPEYMIPAYFVELEALPLTPSGKIDRAHLPVPGRDGFEEAYMAPRNPLEETLAGIWSEVLKLDKVGVETSFFDLGGHSLMATQVVSRIQADLAIGLALRDFFTNATIAALAQWIEDQHPSKQKASLPPIEPVARTANPPLSLAQQRLWFLDKLEQGNPVYNLPASLRLEGPLDMASLKKSMKELVRRHESLRTTFSEHEGQPFQDIKQAKRVVIPTTNLLYLTEEQRFDEAKQLVAREAHRPFDLEQGPLFRVSLLKLAKEDHILLVTMHHIIADGWSVGVMVREVAALYRAYTTKESSPLPELTIQYADFAYWQQAWLSKETLKQQLDYWATQLAGIPTLLEMPTDRPRPALQTYSAESHPVIINDKLTRQLLDVSKDCGATLYMTLLTSYQIMLAIYSRRTDIAVGSPIANRNRQEVEELIGFFVNTLVMRTSLAGRPSFTELLTSVRRMTLDAYNNQDVPFEQVVETLRPKRSLAHSPLFQNWFALQNAPYEELQLPKLTLTPMMEYAQGEFDISLIMTQKGHRLEGSLGYNTDLYDASTTARMAVHWQTLLHTVTTNPDQPISEIALLGQADREQILYTWNETQLDGHKHSVIQMIEERVACSPHDKALVFEGEELTYQSMNEQANRLAHYLRKCGVGPDVPVAICSERSIEMMLGLLAIQKAGGYYVPMDPTYPQDRITHIVADAHIKNMLTQSHLMGNLPKGVKRINLDTIIPLIAEESQQNLNLKLSPNHLAYAIYTSGSTGKPKGVRVSHGNLANFMIAMERRIGEERSTRQKSWLAVTNLTFDIAVLELFWTLIYGYKVVIQASLEESTTISPELQAKKLAFSLFYFSDDESKAGDRYQLLLEGAKFADRNGFVAVWTPERHFHAFGGNYPNPSVTSAALAVLTEHVQIRAGSVVLPLHSPVRVAEEWSVVDNLSKGRVGIAFASGWHADDFVFQPDTYENRYKLMDEHMETVKKLWRGETISLTGGAGQEVKVRTLPRPVQAELPIWVTAAGNPETFRLAGTMGMNLLTHLLGQSLEELTEKIAIYREAWQAKGHKGKGQVSLMLHTFIGTNEEIVREKVREPFIGYLRSSLGLIRNLARSLDMDIEAETFSDADMKALLDHAFDRYYDTSALFGTPSSVAPMIDRLKTIDVDEVACLIDFGVSNEDAMASLEYLSTVQKRANRQVGAERYQLVQQMKRHQVTHMQCTPSMASLFVADPAFCDALAGVKKLMLGGEALPQPLANQLRELVGGQLYNMYGPTETTIWSTVAGLAGADKAVTIGGPVANTQTYILDRNLQPLPDGVYGELHIGGLGVTQGYLNRPALTAEKYLPDPYAKTAGSRIYKTGDLARWAVMDAGEPAHLEIMGRMDHQVKLRGFRIELGEIEAALQAHDHINGAVTIVREDRPGDKRLVAYFTRTAPAEEGEEAIDLRAYLRKKLPDYMIPSVIVSLDALPLSPSGKIDRNALPEPETGAEVATREFVAPRDQTEEAMVSLWTSILRVEKISVHDDFFKLGGHSLLATQVISQIRETFSVELPLLALFETPTVAGLCQRIGKVAVEQKLPQIPPITPAPRQGRQPLSFEQQRLWVLDQLQATGTAYNVPLAMRFTGSLDIAVLQRSIEEVYKRHQVLSAVFPEEDGKGYQHITPGQTIETPLIDLTGLDAQDRNQKLYQLAAQEAGYLFKLDQDRLVRTHLLRLAEQDHVLLLTMHHIISDGWSLGVWMRELLVLYPALVKSETPQLPELPVQYSDYAHWERQYFRTELLQPQRQYWQTQLKELPSLHELATDHPRPAIQTAKGRAQLFKMSESTTLQLRDFSKHTGATLFMCLHAVFTTLLSRYSGESDQVIGVPVANRNRKEIEGLIGFFVNTLVLRTDSSGEPSFKTYLERVRQVALDAFAHQDIPFDQVVDALQPVRSLSHSPLFQVMMEFQNQAMDKLYLPGLDLAPLEKKHVASKFDLSLEMEDTGTEIQGFLEYDSELFEAGTIERMLAHFQNLLKAAITNPNEKISRLIYLSEAEQNQILQTWNQTETSYEMAPLHRHFERQVDSSPQRIALVYNEQHLSYAELDQRANRLAHELGAKGIGPEQRVGICSERSIHLVVGMLGILKAGGAYVPLEPSNPRERLAYMIKDAQLEWVITSGATTDSLQGLVSTLALEAPQVDQEQERPQLHTSLDQAAYMIYTSGTTGKPKGVLNTHRAIVNRLTWMQATYKLSAEDRVLQKTPISFDVSVWEFFWPLISGARLVMAKPEGHRDPTYLTAYIAEQGITTLHFVPSMLRPFLLEGNLEQCTSLRQVFSSGEALSEELRQQYRTSLKAQLHNLYGPTEAAVDVSYWSCDQKGPGLTVPIGRAIANIRLYVLDHGFEPVPSGVPGQLLIGGTGLARGYLNRPGLTAERFVPNPFAEQNREEGTRLYQTGDKVRYLTDGNIEYIGRTDFQVKLRGFRIELGEIEAQLDQNEQVRQAVVLAREDQPGRKRLIAYLTSAEAIDTEALQDQLRAELKAQLPLYMQPSAYVILKALPLTASGKINRKALPAPEDDGTAKDYQPPRTQAEKALSEVWCQVLAVERVGVDDNFFELGGDSILGIQVISRLRKAELEITLMQLFEHQKLGELAQQAKRSTHIQAEQGEVTGSVPLTPVQHWFFERAFQKPSHFNQSVMLTIASDTDPRWLHESMRTLNAHHDALRLQMHQQAEGWQQEIVGNHEREIFKVVDLTDIAEQARTAALEKDAANQQTTLSLEAGLTVKMIYYRLVEAQPAPARTRSNRLLIIVHHLAIDGLSWRILLEDLQNLYHQHSQGKQAHCPPKTTSYKDWAEHLQAYAQSETASAELEYWQSPARQESAAKQTLPRDFEASPDENRYGSMNKLTLSLDRERTRLLLQQVPKAYNTQINDVLLSALLLTFQTWTGHSSLLLDLEGHGRETLIKGTDYSRTIGWFTAIYPLQLQSTDSIEVGEVLKTVKEQLRSVPGRGVGYGILRYLSQHGPALEAMPQAQVMFNYLGQTDQVLSESALFGYATEATGPTLDDSEQRRHQLEIDSMIQDGNLHMHWMYSTLAHRQDTVADLAACYMEQLDHLIDHCLKENTGGFTPSDFPLARPQQAWLDHFAKPGEIRDIYPLSPLQAGLLYHTLYSETTGTYTIQVQNELRGNLNVAALRQAIQRLTDQHGLLRTSFHLEGLEGPLQMVHKQVVLPWQYQDWQGIPETEQQQSIEAYLQQDQSQGFELDVAPLFRIALIRLAEERYLFVWTHHHLLLDGWSLALVLTEIFQQYTAIAEERPFTPVEARPYRDYIAWLQVQDLDRAETYWRQYLAGFTTVTPLAIDKRERETTGKPQGQREQSIEFTTLLSEQLQELARTEKLTLNTLTRGAWTLLLSRYSGKSDVLFGATVSGRPPSLEGMEHMVGMFINTLPVRAQLTETQELIPWLAGLQTDQLAQDELVYSSLVEVQGWSEVTREQALFTSNLVFENYPIESAMDRVLGQDGAGDDDTGMAFGHAETRVQTHYLLTVRVIPGPPLRIEIRYDADQIEDAAITRMLTHLETLLGSMTTKQRLAQLSILTESERQQILHKWNQTAAEQPDSKGVQQLFEQQVARHPSKQALVYDPLDQPQQSMTFEELNRQANIIAHQLIERGQSPDTLVPLLFARGTEIIIAMLGVLKAGAGYLPLDPQLPAARQALIVARSGATLLLTHDQVKAPDCGVENINTDRNKAEGGDTNPNIAVESQQMAYAIFTSGSTGQPKGVVVTHANLHNYLNAIGQSLKLGTDETYAVVSSLAADLGNTTLYPPLCLGGTLHILPEQTLVDPKAFGDYFQKHGIDTLKITPSHLSALGNQPQAEKVLPRKRLILGGEASSWHLVDMIRKLAPNLAIYNHYGPSETTVGVVVHAYQGKQETQMLPLGKPLANTQIYLLDERLEPVPVGIVGQLHIAGQNLTRGYLRMPTQTASHYLPNPYTEQAGSRLYASGDRARYTDEGTLEFLGRIDHQVKIRGYRVELGEIETALTEHEQVRETVTSVWSPKGENQIIAYVVMHKHGSETEDRQTLEAHLATLLPSYMKPSSIIFLEKMPLTPNGKLDRKGLPQPDPDIERQETYVAPRNQTEREIAQIWATLLKQERVGIYDNFYALGGHSLIAAVVMLRVCTTFRIKLLPADLFKNPTVASLANCVHRLQVEQKSEQAATLLDELSQLTPEQIQEMLEQERAKED